MKFENHIFYRKDENVFNPMEQETGFNLKIGPSDDKNLQFSKISY